MLFLVLVYIQLSNTNKTYYNIGMTRYLDLLEYIDKAKQLYAEDVLLLNDVLNKKKLTTCLPININQYLQDICFNLQALKQSTEVILSACLYCLFQQYRITDTNVIDPNLKLLIHNIDQLQYLTTHNKSHKKNSQAQADRRRKMILVMANDIRVVIIKLVEQLCLMHQAKSFKKQEQTALAEECRDIYSPLANRLGLGAIKWQLEDYALRYLDNKVYLKLSASLCQKRAEREQKIIEVINTIQLKCKQHNIKYIQVNGRAKHIHSIYHKMIKKNISFNEVYDALASRVIVNKIEDCYTVLSIIQNTWERVESEFDDYISAPKTNGYRSLHTAVKINSTDYLEVQIRTQQMHDFAEYGVAAHWFYKENNPQSRIENKNEWLNQLMSWQKDIDISNEIGIFKDRVFVYTPNHDIIDLVKGSTPLDFAYSIHTEVGHRCRGCKVNSKLVPLLYKLKTGDIVEVMTKSSASPSKDWLRKELGYLHSTKTRAKLIQWFKHQDETRDIEIGLQKIDQIHKKIGKNQYSIQKIVQLLAYKNTHTLLLALGRGELTLASVIRQIKDTSTKKEQVTLKSKSKLKPIDIKHNDLMYKIAKCCMPLAGDKIIGYITQGYGITIHQIQCRNIKQLLQLKNQRFIQVNWGEFSANSQRVRLQIIAMQQQNIEMHLVNWLNQKSIIFEIIHRQLNKIHSIQTFILEVEMEISMSLIQLCNYIHNCSGVISATKLKS